jgi:uncharacterized protein involved in response to NO
LSTPFWQTAFRPFFLAAALTAIGVAGWWGLSLTGLASAPTVVPPIAWHVHELLYGFAAAVLAGFLLTAAATWTGRPTVSGPALIGLVGLWVLGRLALAIDIGVPDWALALPDALWMVGVAVGIAIPIVGSKNTRNYGFPLIMIGLAACHAAPLAWAVPPPWLSALAWQAALDIIVIALVVVSGRIVPMFSRNGLGEPSVGRWAWADRTANALAIAVLAADLLRLPAWLVGVVGLAAAVAIVVRAVPWRSWLAWRVPLVWVLHLGVLWIAVGLALVAATRLGVPLPPSVGTHALTVGAIGTLCLGMMTRVALGHSGRPLKIGPIIVFAYGAVTAAALVRVGAPLFGGPSWTIAVAAGLFSLAFAVYVGGYLRVLIEPRPDGRPG